VLSALGLFACCACTIMPHVLSCRVYRHHAACTAITPHVPPSRRMYRHHAACAVVLVLLKRKQMDCIRPTPSNIDPPPPPVQALLWPNGVPVTSGCGAPVALNPEGVPLMGPGGLPCCLGPDGDTLLTWEGKALLGPQVSSLPPVSEGFAGDPWLSACVTYCFLSVAGLC
jgi:hypothetical protein